MIILGADFCFRVISFFFFFLHGVITFNLSALHLLALARKNNIIFNELKKKNVPQLLLSLLDIKSQTRILQ